LDSPGRLICLTPLLRENELLTKASVKVISLLRNGVRLEDYPNQKRKWKAHITFENYKSQDKVAMHVPRRQSVALS
jgi:hypothetical protein